MATVIMPKMGDGMEEGTLLRWLKSVGEEVDAGDPIAEIETDKVTLEIEAAEGGVLTQTLVGEGQTVPIGTAIATIGAEGEAPAEAAPAPAQAPAQAPVQAAAAEAGNGAVTSAPAQVADAQPAAPVSAAANGVAGPAEATALSRGPGERLRASPLVKRLAEEHGLDLQNIAGTGPGGRIVKDDIMPYITGGRAVSRQPSAVSPQPPAAPVQQAPAPQPVAAAPAAPSPVAHALAPSGRPAAVARDLSKIRRTTGKRMSESKQVIPHFYVTSEIDMQPAMAFREQVNSQLTDDASKVSFNDLIVKAVALALREFPNLNSSMEGDTLYDHGNIDINIAVAIEGGLIAPFIPDADQKSLGTIARMAKDVITRARDGGLHPNEYQGGTFTISNLGMYDVEEFVAIINPPQAAILAIGSITETPVVRDGQVTVGHQMKISLSVDHRVSDGAEAAKFLIAVKKYLQNPIQLAVS
jgi:pyruvate dehydrogenase E2 component (dihydrolipoamide acetyltransferase)